MKASFANSLVLLAICCTSAAIAQEKVTTNKTDPSGTWRWEYELSGETMKDSLQLTLSNDQKLTGHYKGRQDKLIEIKDAKLAGDALSFLLSLDFQGTPVKLEFKGKVKGDEIDGNVTASTGEGSQEFPWTPKRSVQMEDVVGEWKMKIETGDRTLEPIVTIVKEGEQYKAKYVSGQELTVDVTELKVEKNQLSFSISANVNGTQIKADYKGRPYGDKIEGKIAYVLGDNSGDIDFTGIRTAVDMKNADKK